MPAERPTPTSDSEPQKRLKMKDLEARTGVGRETIRFYIREGLLPEPERPAKNVAWYDEAFVERVRFIKELQEKRYLPLNVIRRIVVDDEELSRAEVDALLDLDGKLFPQVEGAPTSDGESLASVAKRCGIPRSDIRELASTRAIEIGEKDGADWLEPAALQIVETWAEVRRAGFTPDAGFAPKQYGLYVDMVEWLAREELRLFTKGVAGRVTGTAAVEMAERGIDLVGQIIVQLRRNTLLRLISEGDVEPARRSRKRGRKRS